MIPTRRILPQNAVEVRDQLKDIERRVQSDSLNRGDRGDAVMDLQRRMRSFGVFEGKATGVFDAKTESAVRDFQSKAGIIVDGVAGPQTLSAIRQHTTFVQDGFETAAKKGQSGADVKNAERMLKDLGITPGTVDGEFDQKTANAVKSFRAGDASLPDGARIDARTFAKMREQASQPLARGDDTKGVKVLEANLKRLGLSTGTVDEHFSARTKEAVRTFQQRNNLEPTGIADRATRARIQKAVDALAPADPTAAFQTTPPKDDYRRVSRDGEIVNRRTDEMLTRAEAIMKKLGHPNFDFGVVQGSYSTSVGASAGTHDGGGAIDIHTASLPRRTVDHMAKALREAGFAAWSRGRGQDSFDPHIHAIAIGDRELSAQAKSQVQEYFNGGDGLVGSSADPDGNLGRGVPRWAQRFNL